MVVTAQDRIQDVAEIVANLERRGVLLRVAGDSIDYDAPRGVLSIADLGTLLKRKPALIAYLTNSRALNPTPAIVFPPDLDAMRWGAGRDDDERPISIPAERWDWAVANWPHAQWLGWHRLVTELTPWGTPAEEIRLARHRAYLEIKATMNRPAGGPTS